MAHREKGVVLSEHWLQWVAFSLLPPARFPFSLPTCVGIGSSNWVALYLFHWVCQGHLGPQYNPLDHPMGPPSLLRGLAVLGGSPVVVPCYPSAFVCVLEPSGKLQHWWFCWEGLNTHTCVWGCSDCTDLVSGIPAWLADLMGSDICLGVCSLKVLCRGDGVTGLSLGLWDDSTCFAHQLPKPVCCTAMLPRPGAGAGAAIPGNRGSSAALPKAQTRHWELPWPVLPWSIPLARGVLWDMKWWLHSSVLAWDDLFLAATTLGSPRGSAARGWCDPVWQGVIRMCCFTSAAEPTPSAISPVFRFVLPAGCHGGEVPCGGCQLLSWHTVLGMVVSLAPAA